MPMTNSAKPKVGIFSLTGCAGDQLVILNNENVLLAIAEKTDILSFATAVSAALPPETTLDLALVEGSVCSLRDVEVLKDIRARSAMLMAIGTCAVWGGIPAMVNNIPIEQLKTMVYGDSDVFPDASLSQPLSRFVPVDFAIPGCPIEITELTDALGAILAGTEPKRIDYSVCSQCRMRENICLAQSKGIVCCGPITAGGCNARCPSYNQPCQGCRGPVDDPGYDATARLFEDRVFTKKDIIDAIHRFTTPAWAEDKLTPEFAADPTRRGLRRKSVLEDKA